MAGTSPPFTGDTSDRFPLTQPRQGPPSIWTKGNGTYEIPTSPAPFSIQLNITAKSCRGVSKSYLFILFTLLFQIEIGNASEQVQDLLVCRGTFPPFVIRGERSRFSINLTLDFAQEFRQSSSLFSEIWRTSEAKNTSLKARCSASLNINTTTGFTFKGGASSA